MKAFVHPAYGLEALELRELDTPTIADDEVLVRVRASSVNPLEWYRVQGPFFVRFGEGLRRPKAQTIGADLAGRVEAVGKHVRDLQPGDEVLGTSPGSWAEYAAASPARLAPKPANVSFEEAAAIPVAGITALQAVRDHGRVQSGQKVLINGASGGVGTFAVQIAKSFGAEVTAVCSLTNVELVGSLGADRVYDYTREDFTQSDERHDVILDVAGSRPLSELRRVLAPEAIVVVVGAPMSAKGLGPLKHIIGTRLKAVRSSQKVVNFLAQVGKDDLGVLADLVSSGQVRPVIDRRYELSEIPDALDYLGTTHARGKVVVGI